MLLCGATAQAQTDKCQAGIEKEVEKLHKDALQRIDKCLDFAQKEKVKRQKRIDDGNADKPNWDWTKAAFLCEIQLSKTYGATANGAGGSIGKYDAKIDGLLGSKCSRDDLIKLRHQVPATQANGSAPTGGASDISFVREFLKVTAIKRAVATAANANPDWRPVPPRHPERSKQLRVWNGLSECPLPAARVRARCNRHHQRPVERK
jgi:hypothetical protein